MFENPRRGRQARNFTTNVPKILDLKSSSEQLTLGAPDTTHFDSEDDYRTGCRNVSHCQQQHSYSGLRSPGRSNSTYF